MHRETPSLTVGLLPPVALIARTARSEVSHREFHYRWEYKLQASPEELWSFIADTNRFNRDAGLPAVQSQADNDSQLANARRSLRLSLFGTAVEWEEQPFEWVRPHRFGVVRRYLTGPVKEMRVLAELNPHPEGGTQLIYQVWAQPKSTLGFVAIPAQMSLISKRNFAAAFRRYDELAVSGKTPLNKSLPATFAPGGRERLTLGGKKLIAEVGMPELVKRLIETIEQADDVTLGRLRAYALADSWGAPRRSVLELCLWATRVGLLDLQWDVLCPLCRGAGQSGGSLRDINRDVHCDSCNIDYKANFDRSVELTFRPNPAVRQIEVQNFCVGGPQVTPHIVAQQLVAPGARRTLALPLEAGRYRLRTMELPGGQFIQVAPEGATKANFHASRDGWPGEELRLSSEPSICFDNATESEQLFILERMSWSDQAATASEVTALQIFRDLFSTEALRPGEQFAVNSLTILFTDLRDSTRLYREIGDATAFGRVMNHFDVLREAIKAEDGAMVKTIGDAVMAVFRRPAAALRAMLSAQKTLASPPAGAPRLMLKAGLHSGPCIAVTLNDRLDYFGSTVNMAARLEGLSTGGDVIISSIVHADPEVAELIAQPESGLAAQPFEVMLKGFDEERFPLWRVATKG